MKGPAAAASLVLLLAFSGCLDGGGRKAMAEAGEGQYAFEQEFQSVTLRGSLALRAEVEPRAGETCLLTAQGTVVRQLGRFSIFAIAENAKGEAMAYPYGFTPIQVGATVAGVKTSSITDPPKPETFKLNAKFNETRARTMTLFFEDIDATRGPFRVTLQCPTEPVYADIAGSRQAAIIEQSRSSAVTVEAELCPDVMAGASGLEAVHLDAPMRFWLTSAEAVGFVELTGPGVSKTWDLRQRHDAETVDGPAGDYRINLHRASVEQSVALDHFAAGIGAFPQLGGLEDLNSASTPRQAPPDSSGCAQF